MKKYAPFTYAIGLIYILLFLVSCEEIPPYVAFTPEATFSDTTYIDSNIEEPEAKHVIIEEFSGVRCANCPAAQQVAKTIAEASSGRVHIVTAHPLGKFNQLTTPFSADKGDKHTSKFDFRTMAAAQLLELLGLPQGLPSGNINRRLFSGESARNIEYQKWAAYVAEELGNTTPVNIQVEAKNVGDSIEIELVLKYTRSTNDSNYISLMLLESEIIDVQEGRDNNGNSIYIEEYTHKHVLRNMATSYYGDLLNASLVPGRVFIKKYKVKRHPDWNINQLSVLASVHLNTIKKDVLHSKEVKVQ